jgi:two-component system nitrogen regulation sensor histidine kinase NtrY
MRKTRRRRSIGDASASSSWGRFWRCDLPVLGPLAESVVTPALRLVLLADLVYILVVAALVLREVARVIASRRARSAGSRLHLRLTGVFAIVALVPTILVAVFATITVNMGSRAGFRTGCHRARQFGGRRRGLPDRAPR